MKEKDKQHSESCSIKHIPINLASCTCHLIPKPPHTDMTQRTIEDWYKLVTPHVERMKAKYPESLNIEGFEPALTADIVEIVSTLLESERKEAVDAVSEHLPNLSKYEGKEVRFWQGYRKGIQQAVEALTKDTNNE